MYLGIDPGRQKFGWAITDERGDLAASGIAPSCSFEMFSQALSQGCAELRQWLIEGQMPELPEINAVFCGNGTGHADFIGCLKKFGLDAELVDEKNTTLEARALYWKMHPPSGLWRLIPVSLRTPPRSVDDLAACCIVRRALEKGS